MSKSRKDREFLAKAAKLTIDLEELLEWFAEERKLALEDEGIEESGYLALKALAGSREPMSNNEVAGAMKRSPSVAHTGLVQLMARGLARRLRPTENRRGRDQKERLTAIEAEGRKALKRIGGRLASIVGSSRMITDGYETIFEGCALLNTVRKGGLLPYVLEGFADRVTAKK